MKYKAVKDTNSGGSCSWLAGMQLPINPTEPSDIIGKHIGTWH